MGGAKNTTFKFCVMCFLWVKTPLEEVNEKVEVTAKKFWNSKIVLSKHMHKSNNAYELASTQAFKQERERERENFIFSAVKFAIFHVSILRIQTPKV